MKSRWRVKQLLRNAWYRPVSRELDQRMESLFSVDQTRRGDAGPIPLSSRNRWRLAFGGIVTGLVVITGLTWFFAGETPGHDTPLMTSGIPGSLDRHDGSVPVESRGIRKDLLFASEGVVLRSAFTASEMDNRIVLKNRVMKEVKTEESL